MFFRDTERRDTTPLHVIMDYADEIYFVDHDEFWEVKKFSNNADSGEIIAGSGEIIAEFLTMYQVILDTGDYVHVRNEREETPIQRHIRLVNILLVY